MEKELDISVVLRLFSNLILNKGFKVGSVTNTTRATYNKIQSILNIDDYFQSVNLNRVSKPKPSPVPYLEAMNLLP